MTEAHTQVWRPGDPATRQPGNPATRRPGDPATRRPGDPATRRPGDPATRRPGDPATRRPGDPAYYSRSVITGSQAQNARPAVQPARRHGAKRHHTVAQHGHRGHRVASAPVARHGTPCGAHFCRASPVPISRTVSRNRLERKATTGRVCASTAIPSPLSAVRTSPPKATATPTPGAARSPSPATRASTTRPTAPPTGRSAAMPSPVQPVPSSLAAGAPTVQTDAVSDPLPFPVRRHRRSSPCIATSVAAHSPRGLTLEKALANLPDIEAERPIPIDSLTRVKKEHTCRPYRAISAWSRRCMDGEKVP